MTNYYEILGLSTAASHAEIKTAFRRLAKMYHPDRNASGREHFNTILKAYETLSDPVLKSSYDYKLNYHLGQNKASTSSRSAAASNTKTWSFEEKELKRRQYFNEHYKKSNKTTAEYTAEVERKPAYNEYKYILFATPIAVGLFLLIMRLAMPAQPKLVRQEPVPAATTAQEGKKVSQLSMGDMPYASFFGGAKYDPAFKQQLTVKNETTKEVIVCLFTHSAFIRSFYIRPGYFAEVSQLPEEPLFMRYSAGLYFKHAVGLKEAGVSGAFTEDQHFFKSKKAIRPGPDHALALQETPGKEFREINESEFFKTSNNLYDKKN